eukprot:358277-Chlamydomonas_euryale.AAC.2
MDRVPYGAEGCRGGTGERGKAARSEIGCQRDRNCNAVSARGRVGGGEQRCGNESKHESCLECGAAYL